MPKIILIYKRHIKSWDKKEGMDEKQRKTLRWFDVPTRVLKLGNTYVTKDRELL
jgi:hypothetical protein